MTETNPMLGLYRRLKGFGIPKAFVVDTILPDWWDDKIAENPSGFSQGVMMIASYLGLDPVTLRDENASIQQVLLETCKFKKVGSTADSELGLARAMMTSVAKIAISACSIPFRTPYLTGKQVRTEILGNGEHWVSLNNLLDHVWRSGIPVVYVNSLPAKKPFALAVCIDHRPAIVICRKDRYSAQQLFTLAHELGHIALGHVKNGSVLIDEKVKVDLLNDDEELTANEYASEVITGSHQNLRLIESTIRSWSDLSTTAQILARQHNIDPGYIATIILFTQNPTL